MKKCVALLALVLSVVSCNTSEVENENPVAFNKSQLKTERLFLKIGQILLRSMLESQN